MSRRAPRGEVMFGSGSFLDVLANMVGILIILIVIAGQHVPQRAAPKTAAPPDVSAVAATAPTLQPAPEPVPVAPPPEPESEDPPPEFVAQLASIADETARLAAQAAARAAALEKARAAELQAQSHLAQVEKEVAGQLGDLKRERLRLAGFQQVVGQKRETLTGLLAEFEEFQNAKPAGKEIRHHLTPISQEVKGEELFFWLSGGRVAAVPLKELHEHVKTHFERQKDYILRHRQFEGTVGPIRGFTMKYLIQNQMTSSWRERQMGSGTVTTTMPLWQIIPESDIEAETVEEALQPGSRFSETLQAAAPDSSLTYWVYPDSFKLCRKLQSAAHAEGFRVSARPLPFGIPISGSPYGSRSAGQ